MRATAGLALLASLFAAGPPASAADPIDAAVTEEAFIPEVPVSGRPRAGVMEQVPGAGPRAGSVWVRLPEDHGGRPLCIEISSRDGRYTLHLEATPPASQPPGPTRVVYDPRFPRAFAGIDADHMAALAHIGGGCERPGDDIVPVAWAAPGAKGTLAVFVNAARLHAEIMVPRDGGRPVIVTCAALPGGQSIAFDSRCDIDVASLPADARLADARLIRKRGPDRAPPLALPIRLPPP